MDATDCPILGPDGELHMPSRGELTEAERIAIGQAAVLSADVERHDKTLERFGVRIGNVESAVQGLEKDSQAHIRHMAKLNADIGPLVGLPKELERLRKDFEEGRVDDKEFRTEMRRMMADADVRRDQRHAEVMSHFERLQGENTPFVSAADFKPIKATVWGMWGLIGIAVLGAIIALVVGVGRTGIVHAP